jgi:cell division ATPase FtsA
MSIFSFLTGKKKDDIIAIFDIGSSHVTGALVQFSSQSSVRPHILVSKSFSIPVREDPSYDQLVKGTLNTIEEVARFLESKHLGSPKDIVCVLGAPWYTAHTRTVLIQEQTPFVFSKKFADALVAKELDLIQKELNITSDQMLLENKTVSIRLNGYETAEPLNKKTKNVSLSLFTSFMPKDVHDLIQQKMHTFFHRIPVVHTSLFSHTTLLKDMFPDDRDYVLVDVSGETTECSIMRDGVLIESHSFPIGTNHIVRAIMQAEKKSYTLAQQLFTMYLTDVLHGVHNERIDALLSVVRLDWQNNIQQIFGLFAKRLLLPDQIFLFGNKHTMSWYQDILDTDVFHHITFTHKKFKITPINPALIHSLCTFEDGVSRDTCVMIDTVFTHYYIYKK